MNKIYNIFFCSLIITVSSCRSYVEIPAEQVRELKYTSDYQALLYNSTLMNAAYNSPLFASDEMGSTEATWENSLSTANANAYTWAEKFYEANQEDGDWSKLYQQMRLCNTIITEVMDSEQGTASEKQLALASALVHRAFIYYSLVNLYAKQYNPSTAQTDPGVPLLLNTDLFANLKRASVQKVYDQIIDDLNQAVPFLPELPDVSSNPSKAAAYAILARTYLNMREFTQSENYADQALALKSDLSNLNDFLNNTTAIPTILKDPETIFSKTTTQTPVSFPLTPEVLEIMGTKDLRYQVFTADGPTFPASNFLTRGYVRYKYTNDGIYVGPNVPEMMLIKAECRARSNDAAAAIGLLNSLRKNRFIPADYTDLPSSSSNDALLYVIRERRIEFLGRGFRWFDQRRLAMDDAGYVGTVTRAFKEETYTLAPGSNRYVFPIGEKYITMNPEIEQNPR